MASDPSVCMSGSLLVCIQPPLKHFLQGKRRLQCGASVSIRRRCAASAEKMSNSTFRKIVGQRLIRRAHGYLTAQTNCYEGICCSRGGGAHPWSTLKPQESSVKSQETCAQLHTRAARCCTVCTGTAPAAHAAPHSYILTQSQTRNHCAKRQTRSVDVGASWPEHVRPSCVHVVCERPACSERKTTHERQGRC